MSISEKTTQQMKRAKEEGTIDFQAAIKRASLAQQKKALKQFLTNPKMTISKRGYQQIYIPKLAPIKIADRFLSKWMNYHNYVYCIEKGIEEIPKGYHVHHIDGNRFNNKIENLKLINESEHHAEHYKEMLIDPETGRFIKKNI